jgi:1-acyl-sn-glycerol-3-phosphate acyltransferase
VNARRRSTSTSVARPGVPAPALVSFYARVVLPLVRLFHRARLEGVENLPESGPFLLVANHSGGLGAAEINAFIALYAARFGSSRPLAGFAFSGSFDLWPLAPLLAGVGAIPSTYEAAASALSSGVPILVFPGGDREALRPVWRAHRVDFGGRSGFVRIARRAWVPIVPMGIRGSHYTAPVLFRSELLATLCVWLRWVGAKRWALTLLGAMGAAAVLAWIPLGWGWRFVIAWAWVASPLSMLPWIPATIRFRIGPAIPPERLFGDRAAMLDADEDAAARRALPIVQDAVQTLVRS